MKVKALTPMLETADLKATISFYTEILGFECRGLYPDEQQPCWASLWHGESEIAFSLRPPKPKRRKPHMTGSIYLYVEDVESLWHELQGRAEIEYPLEGFDYGMREFGIRDCNGYLLNLGQDISTPG